MHLQAVLQAVRTIELVHLRQAAQRRDRVMGDVDGSERGQESVGGGQSEAAKRHAVAGTDEHDPMDATPQRTQRSKRAGGNRTRVAIAGVRNDEGLRRRRRARRLRTVAKHSAISRCRLSGSAG